MGTTFRTTPSSATAATPHATAATPPRTDLATPASAIATTTPSSATKPQASIVVPLHNSADTFARLLASLQAQTLSNFEAILVDDGSTDNTLALAQAAAETDARFTVIAQDNAGPGVARNVGIDAARGDYIAFMDADDTVAPNFLLHLVDVAQHQDADITICQVTHHYPDNYEALSPDAWPADQLPTAFAPVEVADHLFGLFRNWPWDKLFRRSFLNEFTIRFPALYRTEDLAFTCSALAAAKRIALVNEQLYTYYMYGDESSTATRDNAPTDFFESCVALKTFLDTHAFMDTFAATYVQWVALCCMLNLVELNTREGFNAAYHVLHNGGLEQLGLLAPRASLQRHADTIGAGSITISDVDLVLDIVERYDQREGLRQLIRHGHCGQLLKPNWLKNFSFRHPVWSIKRLVKG